MTSHTFVCISTISHVLGMSCPTWASTLAVKCVCVCVCVWHSVAAQHTESVGTWKPGSPDMVKGYCTLGHTSAVLWSPQSNTSWHSWQGESTIQQHTKSTQHTNQTKLNSFLPEASYASIQDCTFVPLLQCFDKCWWWEPLHVILKEKATRMKTIFNYHSFCKPPFAGEHK